MPFGKGVGSRHPGAAAPHTENSTSTTLDIVVSMVIENRAVGGNTG
jgi:hypothetical protein